MKWVQVRFTCGGSCTDTLLHTFIVSVGFRKAALSPLELSRFCTYNSFSVISTSGKTSREKGHSYWSPAPRLVFIFTNKPTSYFH